MKRIEQPNRPLILGQASSPARGSHHPDAAAEEPERALLAEDVGPAATRGRLRFVAVAWTSARDDPRLRVFLAHVAALGAVIVILASDGFTPSSPSEIAAAFGIAIGFTVLRALSVTNRLASSTLVLDALGTVIFLAGTGAPRSPFYVLALAGVWWAVHLTPRRSGLIYGLTFAIAYVVLVGPAALRERELADALEDVVILVIVALLSDLFVRVDQRALQLSAALKAPPFDPEQLAIRVGLARALGTTDIPLDVVLAAAQLGLTAVQAELLCYLVLGMTNAEVAEAVGMSEATVRYRLTKLYRILGVRGRREAASQARSLGLSLPGRESEGAP